MKEYFIEKDQRLLYVLNYEISAENDELINKNIKGKNILEGVSKKQKKL